jgi:hypothetical protein
MLIRSQDKKNLVNINTINGLGICEYGTYNIYALINSGQYLLGKYSTEENAVRVLDMIEEVYSKPVVCDVFSDNEKLIYSNLVFQMPQDDKVELL